MSSGKMGRIVIGTFNAGKVREMRQILADMPVELRSLADYPPVAEVPETGDTFAENAALKAIGLARQLGEAVLADDSGLEVDALDGAPGVRSARYAGEGATTADLVAKLLDALRDLPDGRRTARFRCCLCLADPSGVRLTAEGVCEGRIVREPRGTNGFGYDPVFVPLGETRTFAEMRPEEKNRRSHRGAAARAFAARLRERLQCEGDAHHGG